MAKRRILAITLCCASATVLIGKPSVAMALPHKQTVLERASELRQSYQIKQAIDLVESTYGRDPDDPSVSILLGDYYNELKDHARSLELYQRALASEPHNPDALVGAADEMAWLQKTPQAIDLCNQVIHDVDAPRSDVARARIVLIGAQAVQAYNHGVVSLIRYALGILPALKEAAATDPQCPQVHYALGRFYLHAPRFMGGNPRKAASELDLASHLDPYDFTIRAWWISAMQHAGQNVSGMMASYQSDYKDLEPARVELQKALALKAP